MVLMLAPGSASAQVSAARMPGGVLELHGVTLSLARDEMVALTNLSQLVNSMSTAQQDAALARARRVSRGPDALYALATYQVAIGMRRRDDVLLAPALDVLIEARRTPARLLPGYVDGRAGIALRAGDPALADRLWTQLAGQRPNDPQLLFNLVQVRHVQGDTTGALDLMRRAIAARSTSDAGPAPVTWYRQWLSIAFNGNRAAEGSEAARALLTAFPTAEQWRFALVAWRQMAVPAGASEIALMRLMRATGALTQGDEYLRFAQLLLRAGAATQARAVMDEGIARGVVQRDGTNVAAIGAEIDRAVRRPTRPSATPSGADAVLDQAVSLANDGQSDAAERAFRAIASGGNGPGSRDVRADLARFWLIHLAQGRPAAA